MEYTDVLYSNKILPYREPLQLIMEKHPVVCFATPAVLYPGANAFPMQMKTSLDTGISFFIPDELRSARMAEQK